MNENFIRNRWLPALRSGGYRQGKRTLRSVDDTFCCLGVACDIYSPDLWNRRDDNEFHEYVVDDNSSDAYLPYKVAEYIGISCEGSIKVHDRNHPDLPEPLKHMQTLVSINDAGFSFVDIANVIEFCLDHPDIAELRPYRTEET